LNSSACYDERWAGNILSDDAMQDKSPIKTVKAKGSDYTWLKL